jgi:Zn-dependent protease with chaperone function
MSVVLLVTGLALLVLPGVGASLGRHLQAREWRRLNRVAIRLGFVMVALGPLLAAVPLVLDVAGVDSVAEVCHHLLGPAAPGGAIVGWASLTISGALLAVAGAAHRRSRRLQRAARIERWFGDHTRLSDATLVVLPTDSVVAYATPGSPAQVVVSRGLTKALGSDELDAVVRHELAHLRNRHDRDLVFAGVVDATLGWIPGLRASTAALRLSIERSADEEASDLPGAREATRRALLKITTTMLGPVPAFTAAFTLLARLDALATPPADPSLRRRIFAFAPLTGLVVAATVGLLGCSVLTDHSLLHLLGDCPTGSHPGE